MRVRAARLLSYVLLLCATASCSSGAGGGGGDDRGTRARADGGLGSSGLEDAGRDDVDASHGGTDGREPGATCDTIECDLGQRCELSAQGPVCVAESCEDLACDARSLCAPAPSGDGFYCADNSCDDALDCSDAQYCNDAGACAPDVCEPGVEQCEGQAVRRCRPDGGGLVTIVTCGGAGDFMSECTVDGDRAYCPCQADWDCPAYTACQAGRCEGTGKAPSCTLAPSSFSEAIPSPEYGTRGDHWGGVSIASVEAQAGTPFPGSTQVVMTPAVANLTDDNGDGEINELDFPEIIFMTFCKAVKAGSRFQIQGVLRAIHGGGPHKGEDVFAACGPNLTWRAGDPTEGPNAVTCPCSTEGATQADLDPTAGVAVGDLDGNGTPEVVVVTQTNTLRIYDHTGRFVAESAGLVEDGVGKNGSPAIANLDRTGLAEIVLGRVVATLKQQNDGQGGLKLAFEALFTGGAAGGTNVQGPIACVADVTSRAAGLEVVAGSSVYHLPRAPVGGELPKAVTSPSDCTSADVPTLADAAREAELKAYCDEQLVLVWHGPTQNPGGSAASEGFCAVADIWGEDHGVAGMLNAPRPGPENPLDGRPEVILITSGKLQIFAGETGTLIHSQDVEPRTLGGAPNVDDFDGDGFPEVGTAFASSYQMIDLQPPTSSCPAWPEVWPTADLGQPLAVARPSGNAARTPPQARCDDDADCDAMGAEFACNEAAGVCVCLHNGWKRKTQDDSSQVTGSSLFDFNGDGTTEVVYNDECFFRVYNGVDGEEVSRASSESRTRTENPVIADVDNDGNAEIVFGTSTESGFCVNTGGTYRDADSYRPGIQVWGDAADRWVSARRIYNQHAYHVTNVLEGGGIPQSEPASWLPLNGRLYNSYRSQPRSGVGIAAPNLVVGAVQLSSPGAACGELASDALSIAVRVENRGDLRVGPGVPLALYGIWSSPAATMRLKDELGNDIVPTLATPLEPGAQVVLSFAYAASNNGRDTLPDKVHVVVDEGDTQRECAEDDNEATVNTTDAAEPLADLGVRIVSKGTCAALSFDVTVENAGAVAASPVRYTLYAGGPSSGGTPLVSATLPAPLAPGASETHTSAVPDFPQKDITVYVVVDPKDAVPECNDANNTASLKVKCAPIVY